MIIFPEMSPIKNPMMLPTTIPVMAILFIWMNSIRRSCLEAIQLFLPFHKNEFH